MNEYFFYSEALYYQGFVVAEAQIDNGSVI